MAKQKDEITKKGGILLNLVAEGYKKKEKKKVKILILLQCLHIIRNTRQTSLTHIRKKKIGRKIPIPSLAFS